LFTVQGKQAREDLQVLQAVRTSKGKGKLSPLEASVWHREWVEL